MKPSVYLAGPIAGLHYDAAQDWRSAVRDALAPEIDAFSPLRSKEYLRKEGVLRDQYAYAPLSSDRGITTRDHFDCQRCDIIFCNLLGANSVSIGTVMEIAWSYSYSKPLVLLMEPSGNIQIDANYSNTGWVNLFPSETDNLSQLWSVPHTLGSAKLRIYDPSYSTQTLATVGLYIFSSSAAAGGLYWD